MVLLWLSGALSGWDGGGGESAVSLSSCPFLDMWWDVKV